MNQRIILIRTKEEAKGNLPENRQNRHPPAQNSEKTAN